MPDNGSAILEYFDKTYVTGTFRRINSTQDNCIRLRNCPPLFSLHVWNLVGHCHPSIWVLITKIHLEVANDETKLPQSVLGTLPKKKKPKIYALYHNDIILTILKPILIKKKYF
ncbi:Uncharacterized protein FWK35_00018338 [Aphis craccivora]|uniref:Uncharacterized protein n=1 Tax=Aphis craccivora TaxID=307492 RepID=A0A6G0Y9I8_APHCR|nr:Uncharacterized protein FWK35_00018338 [Aphis craccivora]